MGKGGAFGKKLREEKQAPANPGQQEYVGLEAYALQAAAAAYSSKALPTPNAGENTGRTGHQQPRVNLQDAQKNANALGTLSAACAGSLLAIKAANRSFLMFGGIALASGALGMWVKKQLLAWQLRAAEEEVVVMNRAFQCVGVISESRFLELCQRKSVTLHDLKTQVSGAQFVNSDQGSVVTHAIFYQCDEAANLYDVDRFPFFHQAQRETFQTAFAVPIKMFYRVSAQLLHKEKLSFLLVPSPGRCGSTLLGKLIGLHPKIITISEPKESACLHLLASAAHASGWRYTEGGALVAAAAAGTVVAGVSWSCAELSWLDSASALVAGGATWLLGLIVSDRLARREAPRLVQASFRFWLKDVGTEARACVKLTANMSSIFLADNAWLPRAAGLDEMQMVILYRDLVPTLKSYRSTFGDFQRKQGAMHGRQIWAAALAMGSRWRRAYMGLYSVVVEPVLWLQAWSRTSPEAGAFVSASLRPKLDALVDLVHAALLPRVLSCVLRGVTGPKDANVGLLWRVRASTLGAVAACHARICSQALPPATGDDDGNKHDRAEGREYYWKQMLLICSILSAAQQILRCAPTWARSVKYEDVLLHPRATLDSVLRSCGLDASAVSDEAVLACMARDSQKNSTISWQSRNMSGAGHGEGSGGVGGGSRELEEARTRDATLGGCLSQDDVQMFNSAISAFGLQRLEEPTRLPHPVYAGETHTSVDK